eukprot:scaffold90766_cov69-Phaeocystis_antarctica.AAC.3
MSVHACRWMGPSLQSCRTARRLSKRRIPSRARHSKPCTSIFIRRTKPGPSRDERGKISSRGRIIAVCCVRTWLTRS